MSELNKILERKGRHGAVIPVHRVLPTDLLTPISALMRLRRHHEQVFLLENLATDTHPGYSFLGVQPFQTLRVRGGQVELEKNGQVESLPGPVWPTLQAALMRYQTPSDPDLPPFQGGAVGFMGYDCVRYLERIPMPGSEPTYSEACMMHFSQVVAFDHARHRVVLIANIFPQEESIEAGYQRCQMELDQLCRWLLEVHPDEQPLLFPLERELMLPEEGVMGREAFGEAVRQIKRYIRSGDIFQCVLSEQFKQPITADPFNIYRVLRTMNPSPYLFYLSTGEEILLGASPEMLVKADGKTIQTCPIAGTRPRGQTPETDRKLEASLLASVKEKAEHLMLVDLGRNDLGRVAKPGTVSVKQFMQVERYSHVMHLVSLVEAQLKRGASPWDALAACFPAGTLSGAPKVRAMEIISELEPFRRGPYGGAVLYQSFGGQLDSCITIRSLLVRDGIGTMQAGAGVVADSNPDREYDEARNKARAVLRAIALAEGMEIK